MSQCQSCSMLLKKDPRGGGTEADGSKSAKYCSLCYAKGKFLQPDITVKDMQELVKNKIREFGFPGFLAAMMARGVPKLERWRSQEVTR